MIEPFIRMCHDRTKASVSFQACLIGQDPHLAADISQVINGDLPQGMPRPRSVPRSTLKKEHASKFFRWNHSPKTSKIASNPPPALIFPFVMVFAPRRRTPQDGGFDRCSCQ